MYKPGGILTPHNDNLIDPFVFKRRKTDYWQPRMITLCLYLNRDYQDAYGGKFVIYDKQEGREDLMVKVSPQWGTVALFRSYD